MSPVAALGAVWLLLVGAVPPFASTVEDDENHVSPPAVFAPPPVPIWYETDASRRNRQRLAGVVPAATARAARVVGRRLIRTTAATAYAVGRNLCYASGDRPA
jgi:predicted secreted protein